jgi:tetratricopeptide (TPR) repeat protein
VSRQSTVDSRQSGPLPRGYRPFRAIGRRLATAGYRLSIVLATVTLLAIAAPAGAAGLTEGPRLAAVYDTILQAQFDAADAQLAHTCPPAPMPACKALRAMSAWWRILLDPQDRRMDATFNGLVDAAIAASEDWTAREPERAEAWFYLAGSLAPRIQWRVTRGERLAAARDGSRVKSALERSLQLDPTLDDAYFGIGLYHYYAGVVPAAAKVLQWLLFLPGGDRVKGMQEMLRAREHGQLLKGEADYQLHLVYLWYEHRPTEALELLEGLEERYPTNPLFLQRIAEVLHEYAHDEPGSTAAWRTLLERARAGKVSAPSLAETYARLGLATELDAMFETDLAITELRAVVNAQPHEPPYARALAELQLGAAYDRLGDRVRALAAYDAAASLTPNDDPLDLKGRARAARKTTPDVRAANAYRLSLEGWRALERGDAAQAEAKLAQSLQFAPGDSVARYRYAQALIARGNRQNAREELQKVIAALPVAPPFVLASAYVACAQLAETAGDRSGARVLYQAADKIVGGDPVARERARVALKRLAAP